MEREPKTFTVAGRDVSGGQGSVRSSLGKLSPVSSRRLARSHKRSQHPFGATGMPQPICVVVVVVVRGYANALLRGIRSRVMSHVSPLRATPLHPRSLQGSIQTSTCLSLVSWDYTLLCPPPYLAYTPLVISDSITLRPVTTFLCTPNDGATPPSRRQAQYL